MLRKALVVLCLALAVQARPRKNLVGKGKDTWIVGGSNASPGEFPYQVHVDYASGSLSCGGSILDEVYCMPLDCTLLY